MYKCAICKESDQPRHGRNRPLHEAVVRVHDNMAYPQEPLDTVNKQRGFGMRYPRSKVATILCHEWCDPNMLKHDIKIR